jgi:hypothetical protein
MSREQELNHLYSDDFRVQYNEEDGDRIQIIAEGITGATVDLIGKLANYRDVIKEEISEDSESRTRLAREELVEAWAWAQFATSYGAWALRIDGDQAFKKAVDFMREVDNDAETLDTAGI